MPAWVDADADRMEQVIVNLLTNALKYTPPGGSVTVALEHEHANVVLKIEDDGIGIPPELLPRVFDLFVQGARGAYGTPGDLASGSRWSGASCNCTAALSMRPLGARDGGACSPSVFQPSVLRRASPGHCSLTPRADRPAPYPSFSPAVQQPLPPARENLRPPSDWVIQRAAFYGRRS